MGFFGDECTSYETDGADLDFGAEKVWRRRCDQEDFLYVLPLFQYLDEFDCMAADAPFEIADAEDHLHGSPR